MFRNVVGALSLTPRPAGAPARLAVRLPLSSLLLLGLVAVMPATAFAQSATNGGVLYRQLPTGGGASCDLCHSDDPLLNLGNILNAANNPSVIAAAIAANKGGMGSLAGKWSAGQLADIAAYLGNPTAGVNPMANVSPMTLTFGSTTVGGMSANFPVNITNNGNATLNFTSINTIMGSAFSIATNSCGASLAVGQTCTLGVRFSPVALGTVNSQLTIVSNAANGTQTLAMSGSGSSQPMPTPSLAETVPAVFPNTSVGQASAARLSALTNSGVAGMTIATLTVTGTNRNDFRFGTGAGACAVGTNLPNAGTCNVRTIFTPSGPGERKGRVVLTTDTGTQLGFDVSGLGTTVALPAASAAPTSLTFADTDVAAQSPTMTSRLTNTGSADLVVTAIQLTGPFRSVALAGSCPSGSSFTLLPGAGCDLDAAFVPVAAGGATGAINVSSAGATGALSVALAGTGKAVAPAPGGGGGGGGGGGCSVAADGRDPALPVMAFLAMLVLGMRRIRAGAATHAGDRETLLSDPGVGQASVRS